MKGGSVNSFDKERANSKQYHKPPSVVCRDGLSSILIRIETKLCPILFSSRYIFL